MPHTYDEFSPTAYLEEYYAVLSAENRFLMKFYHRTYSSIGPVARMLEIGGGPTLYQLISASRQAEEIVFSDFLVANRTEVENWLAGAAGVFNWDAYFALAAELETGSAEAADALKGRVRRTVRRIVFCDLLREEPVVLNPGEVFEVVSSAFCIECIAGDSVASLLEKIHRLLRADGTLVLTLIRNSSSYRVGSAFLPAQPVNEQSLRALLDETGFDSVAIQTLVADSGQGYDGIMAVTARRRS